MFLDFLSDLAHFFESIFSFEVIEGIPLRTFLLYPFFVSCIVLMITRRR